MRSLCLATLFVFACKGAGSEICAPAPESSAVFQASQEGDLPPDVQAALDAGRVVEAAAQSARTFDQKILTIAQDPALSEKWASVVKISGPTARESASEARVAADLPLLTSRLRAAGVSTGDVLKLVDGATRGRISAEELAGELYAIAPAVEKYGPIKDFGDFMSDRLSKGLTGAALEQQVEAEHAQRGKKVLDAGEGAGDKVTICHRPPGNPDNQKTLEVGASALDAHLGHGDTEGACDDEQGASSARSEKSSGGAGKAGAGKGSGSGKAGGGSGKAGGSGAAASGKGSGSGKGAVKSAGKGSSGE